MTCENSCVYFRPGRPSGECGGDGESECESCEKRFVVRIAPDEPTDMLVLRAQEANASEGGTGGSCLFVHPGRGWSRTPGFKPQHGRVVFATAENKEVFVIDGDGKCIVNGEHVATNLEAFEGFLDWLYQCMRPVVPIEVPSKVEHLHTTAGIGVRVWVVEADSSVTETVTRSAPWQLGDGQWVVDVLGRYGHYKLKRVFRAP